MTIPPNSDNALSYSALIDETRRVYNRQKSFSSQIADINKKIDEIYGKLMEMRTLLDASMTGNISGPVASVVAPETGDSDDKMNAIELDHLDEFVDTESVSEDEEPYDKMTLGIYIDKNEISAAEWGQLPGLTDTEFLPEDELPGDKMNTIDMGNLDELADMDAVSEDEEPYENMTWGIYIEKSEISAAEWGKLTPEQPRLRRSNQSSCC
ncbi:hypothetical protein BZA77DRAFT_361580 [Pyronema omphalodes]|nr:hypothetical protein BZA77DRAFT_361580 [Pyronema omphalodes]